MTYKRYILGIDTSCDETSCAILDMDSQEVLSNVISSQVKLHAPYGGVVPELASRSHCENISLVFEEALKKTGLTSQNLNAIAVTQTPGLIGCLLVGASFARALAYQLNIPLYGINHLTGHLFSPFIGKEPVFPSLGLVVSGGHTAFYKISSFDDVVLLGQTVDDAAGEVFDKGAKMMGLGYPGGPIVDQLAKTGDDQAVPFTIANVKMGKQFLSFSGLKTAVYYYIQEQKELTDFIKANLCASLQKTIVKTLTQKIEYFFSKENFKAVTLSGGVALNSLLRTEVQELCDKLGISCYIASPQFCADNGAMIAYAALVGSYKDQKYSLNVQPSKKIQARQMNSKLKAES